MKKRRQHYVWRKYLRAWSQDEAIWCYRAGKIFRSNLMGVAQQKDFYRLSELTERDLFLIEKTAIEGTKNPLLREANYGWLQTFQNFFRVRKIFESKGISGSEVERMFDVMANNMEEELHSLIEGNAVPYIDALLKLDESVFSEDDNYMGLCHFLAVQYLRTNKIKQNLLRNCGDLIPGHIDRAMGIYRHIYATNIAWSIYANRTTKNLKPYLLENDSNVKLIAGDQPIINTHAVETGYAEIVEDVEFYYPVSPGIALIITEEEKYAGAQHRRMTASQADAFNELIVKSAEEQIYGRSKADLEPYVGLVAKNVEP